MVKRTLYFGNPTYLSLKNKQLVIKLPEVDKNDTLSSFFKEQNVITIAIEDIGIIVLDNNQITITSSVIESLLENNVSIITCDKKHLPVGLMLPLFGNTTQSEKFRYQMEASKPLKKHLWQQTIISKINNQADVLEIKKNLLAKNMRVWANNVKSGDSENKEARAAAYYWKVIFPDIEDFTRDRFGMTPNNLLNYGYAILRAIVARALVSSGLLPTLGIFHKNKYNAYCLADDVMEPYRPYVDIMVIDIMNTFDDYDTMTKEIKTKLLSIPVLDVTINGKRSPLMVAVSLTTSSLQKCYAGENRKILYPTVLL